MRRLLIFAGLAAGMFLARRKIAERLGPAIRKRCSEACERMLANMPESFPPNRMLAGLETLEEQNARILGLVERRTDERR